MFGKGQPIEVPAPERLMLGFESLGERCDFGSVQLHFGADPLGLLRFSYAPLDVLIRELDSGFAGVGSTDDTDIVVEANGENTLYLRCGFRFHTYIFAKDLPTEADRSAFRHQQLRRLQFLRGKIIGDLTSAEKIFVYANDDRPTIRDAERLFSALNRYGPNALLFVRPDAVDFGCVHVRRSGLYLGHYARRTNYEHEQPPFDLWLQLCEAAWRLHYAS